MYIKNRRNSSKLRLLDLTMKTMMKLKTALLLLFVSISISSFAVSDSLCSCLQYYYLDQRRFSKQLYT